MKTLVVYESMFGNTRTVAEAIAEGLATCGPADLVEVGEAPNLIDDSIDLVVAGGPTHAFSLSRPKTRGDAASRGIDSSVSTAIGLREWIAGLSQGEWMAATFDTRMTKPRLPGSAARLARRRLRRAGHEVIAPPMSFWVSGVKGPLVPGEIERARRWGRTLADTARRVLGQQARS